MLDWNYLKNKSKFILVSVLLFMICFVLPVNASTWSTVKSSTWTISSIDYNSYDPSLALDSYGRPHIGYKDLENYDLKYAVWQGNSWTTTTVDSESYAGYSPSLALDSNDQPHISYTLREPITSTSVGYETKEYLKYAVLENAEVTSSPPLRDPLNLKATIGNDNVTLSWSPPNLDGGQSISNYKIYRGTISGAESFLAIAGNATTYTDSFIDNGITYYYQVSAVSSEGEGAKSNQATTTLNPSNPPINPTNSNHIIIILFALIVLAVIIVVPLLLHRKHRKSSKSNQ